MERYVGKPLKIFISYGHDTVEDQKKPGQGISQAEICDRIYKALESRGHEPWLDDSVNGIPEGADWRAAIQKGIGESDEVLFCISNRSLREGSVCLEELSLAKGWDGMGAGKVQGILLEPESQLRYPLPDGVAGRQWFDFTGWRDFPGAPEEEALNNWFGRRMMDLLPVLEGERYRSYAEEIQKIRRILRPETDIFRKDNTEGRYFTGRRWLEKEVEGWTGDSHGKRFCMITGDPGIGKSAFAAQYAKKHPEVIAEFYFRSQNDRKNTLCDVIRSMAYCLAGRLEHYRRELLHVLDERKEEWAYKNKPEQLFEQLIEMPLAGTIDGGHSVGVILLDGLDECGEEAAAELLKFLNRRADRLPDWIQFLIFSREDPKLPDYLNSAKRIFISGNSDDNLQDVRGYYEERLRETFGAEPDFAEKLDLLTTQSEGIFLAAVMTCDLLLQEGDAYELFLKQDGNARELQLKKKGSGEPKELSSGLGGSCRQWFDRCFARDGDYKEDFLDVLQCIVGAPIPITRLELKRLFGWDESRLEDFTERMGMLLSVGRDELAVTGEELAQDRYDTFEISHRFVREWLTTRKGNPEYYASPEEGERKLTNAVFAAFEDFERGEEELTRYETAVLPELLRRQEKEKVRCTKGKIKKIRASRAFFTCLLKEAAVCVEWGRLDAAERFYEEAGEIVASWQPAEDAALSGRDRRLSAEFYHASGQLEEMSGSRERAQERFEKAAALILNSDSLAEEAQTPEDRKSYARICGSLAEIKKRRGDFFGALRLWEESRTCYEAACKAGGSLADRKNLAKIYMGMAEIEQFTGGEARAERLYKEAENFLWETGKKDPDADQLLIAIVAAAARAKLLAHLGKAAEAEKTALAAKRQAEELGSRRGTVQDIQNLLHTAVLAAELLQRNGKYPEAMNVCREGKAYAEKLLALRGTLDDKIADAGLEIRMAGLASECGNCEEALSEYRSAVRKAKEICAERGSVEDQVFCLKTSRKLIDFLWKNPDENREELTEVCRQAREEAARLEEERGALSDRWNRRLLEDLLRFLEEKEDHEERDDAADFIRREKDAWRQFRTDSLGLSM